MAPPTRYKVNPDELFSHARAVAQLQQPLDRVVAAAKAASPNGISTAYGVLCQQFALVLLPVREYAEDTVEKISRSVDSAANQLVKAVDTYVTSDQKSSRSSGRSARTCRRTRMVGGSSEGRAGTGRTTTPSTAARSPA